MCPIAFLQNIGMPELVVILLIALLLFGQRLPNLGRSLGRSISEFKSGLKEGAEEESKTPVPAEKKA
jgi:sec-independent protein translocase protein TatA